MGEVQEQPEEVVREIVMRLHVSKMRRELHGHGGVRAFLYLGGVYRTPGRLSTPVRPRCIPALHASR